MKIEAEWQNSENSLLQIITFFCVKNNNRFCLKEIKCLLLCKTLSNVVIYSFSFVSILSSTNAVEMFPSGSNGGICLPTAAAVL